MDAFRREAAILRHQARQMMARADEIDPPIVPVKAAPAPRLLCPDCGTEYGGPEYRAGDPCLTERCVGLIGRKGDAPDRSPEWERCAKCGGTVSPQVQFFNGGLCPACQPMPDLAEPIRTTDGRSLGVTLGELAMQQAWRDLGELPGLDIASSYGGRP